MNDLHFIERLFSNGNETVTIKKNDDLYKIIVGDVEVSSVLLTELFDDIYNMTRYDPKKLNINTYVDFLAMARFDHYTTIARSFAIPPSYEYLESLGVEFVKSPSFVANNKTYSCMSRKFESGEKPDFSVFKYLYSMYYDHDGNCTIRGVLRENVD